MLKKKSITLPTFALIFLFTLCFICGCTKNSVNQDISAWQNASISSLPLQLQGSTLSFDKLLQFYDWLNDKQKIVALQYLLGQQNLNERQNAEAAYMLARLFQQSADPATKEQVPALLDLAATYTPLKVKSLWHKSEIASSLGKEKLVRQTLAALLAEIKDGPQIAAAQYALAQSYIRANETDNACNLFNKIRADFPGSNYAVGASYYLGTLSYNQFLQKTHSQHNLPQPALFKLAGQKSDSELLHDACTHYFEYIQASPDGHFTPDILHKLENLIAHNFWQAKESELVLMAEAYSAIHQYKACLACWQKIGINKHLLAVSSCLVQLGQFTQAKEKFLQALANNVNDQHSIVVAYEISSHLNKADCLHFWQQLHHSKFAFQDEALWNIAIRVSPSEALHHYQDLLIHYPHSIRAPEAQWRLLWQKFKSTKPNFALAVANLFYKAALQYNHSQLAPRFLFWAGKIVESVNDKKAANFYYQEVLRLYSAAYYGQRANARLNFINKAIADDYFRIKYYSHHFAKENTDSNQLADTFVSSAAIWDCPPPEQAIETAKQKGWLTFCELIYIKQYAEALAENNGTPPELIAWLQGKCGQPWLAINTASQCLEDKSCPISDPALLWQYSFPRLYKQEIVANCQNTQIVDPLLIQSLVREESRYNPKAISPTGALGLCQLMPATASGIAQNAGVKITNKVQLFQPDLNLALGISYLASDLRTFDNNGLPAIASYNAGINAVKNFLVHSPIADADQFVEDFPFRETRDYIRKVFASYGHYKQIYK